MTQAGVMMTRKKGEKAGTKEREVKKGKKGKENSKKKEDPEKRE